MLIVLNFSRRDQRATISEDPALADVLGNGALEDALTGERIEVRGDTPTFEMPAHSVHVLVPAGGGGT